MMEQKNEENTIPIYDSERQLAAFLLPRKGGMINVLSYGRPQATVA